MTVLMRSALAALMMLLTTAIQADTARFVAGIEYQEILPAQQTRAPAGKIEVVEVFGYSCPHCYRLEPELKKWLQKKPANVHFFRMPAQFNQKWEILAGAYFVAESLDMIDKVHLDIFKEIHDKKNKLDSVDKMAAFFLRYGVTREKYVKVLNSFSVRSRQAHAKGMEQRYGVRSVPTIIINGKYRTSETMAGNKKDMFAVIEELVAMEVKAQQKQQAPAKTK